MLVELGSLRGEYLSRISLLISVLVTLSVLYFAIGFSLLYKSLFVYFSLGFYLRSTQIFSVFLS